MKWGENGSCECDIKLGRHLQHAPTNNHTKIITLYNTLTYHDTGLTGTSNKRGEDGSWGVISSESSCKIVAINKNEVKN